MTLYSPPQRLGLVDQPDPWSRLPQFASRFAAGASGFLIFSQSSTRPER
jgi:hypothetical protein